MNDSQRLITIVAYLLSEDGDNPEYDRACAEIVTEYLGFPMDAKDEVLHLLRVKGGVNEPEVNEPESVTEPYVLHYISADGPGESAPWSVYREFYPSDGDESPIEGTQVHVSRHATEYVAAAEAFRLQAQANKPASVTEYQGRHRS